MTDQFVESSDKSSQGIIQGYAEADAAGRQLLYDADPESTQGGKHTSKMDRSLCALNLGVWTGIAAYTIYKGQWNAAPWTAGVLGTQLYSCADEIDDTFSSKK